MTNNNDNLSAIDAIRCVFLARTAGQRGDHESARRWQAKADTWLARQRYMDEHVDSDTSQEN